MRLLTVINSQILQLFDFDIEVKPILEVLVGKTIEQALMEVMEEEELANLRAQQVRKFFSFYNVHSKLLLHNSCNDIKVAVLLIKNTLHYFIKIQLDR